MALHHYAGLHSATRIDSESAAKVVADYASSLRVSWHDVRGPRPTIEQIIDKVVRTVDESVHSGLDVDELERILRAQAPRY